MDEINKLEQLTGAGINEAKVSGKIYDGCIPPKILEARATSVRPRRAFIWPEWIMANTVFNVGFHEVQDSGGEAKLHARLKRHNDQRHTRRGCETFGD